MSSGLMVDKLRAAIARNEDLRVKMIQEHAPVEAIEVVGDKPRGLRDKPEDLEARINGRM